MTAAPPEQAWFAKADEDLEMASDLGYVLDTFPPSSAAKTRPNSTAVTIPDTSSRRT